jgi:hypothetical protein
MTAGATRPVVLTFVHHPADEVAAAIVEAAAALAEGVGAERAGVYMRVPVRVRAQPFGLDGSLRPITPSASDLDVVVFLKSLEMQAEDAHAPFEALLKQVRRDFADPSRFLFLSVLLDDVDPPRGFDTLQGIRWYEWAGLDKAARRTRALIRIVAAVREKLGGVSAERHSTIFVSHAKRDGRALAEDVVRHVRDPKNALGLDTFYDALELRDGEEFDVGLEDGVRGGALLALVSDAYEGRPWCNQEVLWAKRWRCPAVLVDVGRQRVSRTYPYLGNLPLRCHDLAMPEGREAAILDLVTEMLRVDLFTRVAARIKPGVVALPRPPELLDLIVLKESKATRVLYPDPPLADAELTLLRALAPGIKFCTLDEVRP